MSEKPTLSQQNRRAIGFTLTALGAGLLILVLALVWKNLPELVCSAAADNNPCVRVLFIGNSYTYVNDLPGTFARLARSGGHPVRTGMLAEGGWTLADHVQSSQTLETLQAQRWNYVILQEQSEIPAFEQSRTLSMYPAARQLAGEIRAVQAEPVFLQTWAHRDGMPEQGIPDYESMQGFIDAGYRQIARELNVPVIPAGDAWRLALGQKLPVDLWQADGSHPTPAGTYLTACVLYATLYNKSPVGIGYTGGLSRDTALSLQKVAYFIWRNNAITSTNFESFAPGAEPASFDLVLRTGVCHLVDFVHSLHSLAVGRPAWGLSDCVYHQIVRSLPGGPDRDWLDGRERRPGSLPEPFPPDEAGLEVVSGHPAGDSGPVPAGGCRPARYAGEF
jgi:hypothetical protein